MHLGRGQLVWTRLVWGRAPSPVQVYRAAASAGIRSLSSETVPKPGNESGFSPGPTCSFFWRLFFHFVVLLIVVD